jgi:nucleoside-diphosphate-sugar epimerase
VLLVTGATGKVGTVLINRLLREPRWQGATIRALCHNRLPPASAQLEVVKGDIADSQFVELAMKNVTHVVHLATCKEIPEIVMDVTVKGLFWLLEAFRKSAAAQQFVLIGGDAGVGHFFHEHDGPVTEKTPHMAYPGSYALSKVLEEVMLKQFTIQYGINTCCLRAPWIMEKDDFRYSMSFGDDVFGGPNWKTMVAPEVATRCLVAGTIPLLRDHYGRPLKRNFVHVDDLVEAIVCALSNPGAAGQLFNISMDAPIDYGEVAAYLQETRNLGSIDIASSFHSNWLDNSKARFALGWKPRFDMPKLVDAAWSYQRTADDPRKVWYPG